MGFVHAYDVACAAFLDQQLKHLGDLDGSPSLHALRRPPSAWPPNGSGFGRAAAHRTAGVRSTLSSARLALRCDQCPLCGRCDVVAKDASDPTQLGELDRRHFVLADECIDADDCVQGAPGLSVLRLIDGAIDAAIAAVPGCGQLPTLARGCPVDKDAELQLHTDLERLRTQLGCKNMADEDGKYAHPRRRSTARGNDEEWWSAMGTLCGNLPQPGQHAGWLMRTSEPLTHGRTPARRTAHTAPHMRPPAQHAHTRPPRRVCSKHGAEGYRRGRVYTTHSDLLHTLTPSPPRAPYKYKLQSLYGRTAETGP
jgi:hypothetical protein